MLQAVGKACGGKMCGCHVVHRDYDIVESLSALLLSPLSLASSSQDRTTRPCLCLPFPRIHNDSRRVELDQHQIVAANHIVKRRRRHIDHVALSPRKAGQAGQEDGSDNYAHFSRR